VELNTASPYIFVLVFLEFGFPVPESLQAKCLKVIDVTNFMHSYTRIQMFVVLFRTVVPGCAADDGRLLGFQIV
jgi:hypothetical protein